MFINVHHTWQRATVSCREEPEMKRDFLPNPEIRHAKDALRRTMRERLRGMAPASHAEASLVICQRAAHQPEFQKARCVALFAPLPSEPDVRLLIEEAWAENKRVVLPLMIKHPSGPELDWHHVTSWEEVVLPGPFGLREPDPLHCPRIPISEIDCVFVPGLAFDQDGYRLGRGGGFYDYFLTKAPANLPRFGLMFECQRVANVPHEQHDQRLKTYLTEKEE
jgi:5-formyltetrahydrofolate cyclo-ligase